MDQAGKSVEEITTKALDDIKRRIAKWERWVGTWRTAHLLDCFAAR